MIMIKPGLTISDFRCLWSSRRFWLLLDLQVSKLITSLLHSRVQMWHLVLVNADEEAAVARYNLKIQLPELAQQSHQEAAGLGPAVLHLAHNCARGLQIEHVLVPVVQLVLVGIQMVFALVSNAFVVAERLLNIGHNLLESYLEVDLDGPLFDEVLIGRRVLEARSNVLVIEVDTLLLELVQELEWGQVALVKEVGIGWRENVGQEYVDAVDHGLPDWPDYEVELAAISLGILHVWSESQELVVLVEESKHFVEYGVQALNGMVQSVVTYCLLE